MQFHSRFAIPGLIVLLSVLLPNSRSLAAEVDFKDVAASLVARAAGFTEGSIHYRNFSFLTTESHYGKLRGLIVESQQRHDRRLPVRDTISISLSSNAVEPLSGYSGAIFFKGDRQRLLRLLDEDYDTGRERIQQRAAQLGVRAVIDDTWSEEIAFDGETLKLLRNERTLVYPAPRRVPPFQLMQLDMSLAPWEVAIEKGANIGQVISATEHNGRYRITFTNHPGTDRMSVGTYEFDPRLDFAPTRIDFVSQGRLRFEILYGYDRLDETTVARPSVKWHAKFKPDGKVRVNLWLLDKWTQHVSDDDLEIDLPPVFLVRDQRAGAEPPVYFQKLSGEVISIAEHRSLELAQRRVETLTMLLEQWGNTESRVDSNRDGIVDWLDLLILIKNWQW